MPTPMKGPRLGAGPAHQRAMMAGLASALFEHGRITTTEAKAKRLRPVAERLITFAKRGDLHARRRVLTVVRDKGVVHTLFSEIGPRYAARPGGYTRITKVGPRRGDNAPMAVIELVEPMPADGEEGTTGGRRSGRTGTRRGTRRTGRRAQQAPVAAAATEAEAAEAEATAPEAEAEATEAEATEAEATEPAADDLVEEETGEEPASDQGQAEHLAEGEEGKAEDTAVDEEGDRKGEAS